VSSERSGDVAEELASAIQQQALARTRLIRPGQRLEQPRLDPRPDSSQLAHPTAAHEVGHRQRRAPDRLGRAPIRPHRVRVSVGQLEQGRKRFEAVGDEAVVHAP